MATTQYVGARYVPLFADPAEWSNQNAYEPLTIVVHEGNSYTSKMAVPKGVDISNEKYWALTGNYNAQVEEYRKEVKTFGAQLDDNTAAIKEETTRAESAETILVEKIEKEIEDREYQDNVLTAALTVEETARKEGDTQLDTKFSNTTDKIMENVNELKNKYILIIGDSWSYLPGYETQWWNYIADKLQLTPIRYMLGGESFTSGGNSNLTYIEQLNKGYSEYGDKIKAVYLQGFVNDSSKSATDMKDYFSTFYNRFINLYPNLTLNVLIASLFYNTSLSTIKNFNTFKNLIRMYTNVNVINALGCVIPHHYRITTSEPKGVHPSQAGLTALGNFVVEKNNYEANYAQLNTNGFGGITVETNVTEASYYVSLNGVQGSVFTPAFKTTTTIPATSTKIATIDNSVILANLFNRSSIFVNCLYPLMNNEKGLLGYCLINTNGEIIARPSAEIASGTLLWCVFDSVINRNFNS